MSPMSYFKSGEARVPHELCKKCLACRCQHALGYGASLITDQCTSFEWDGNQRVLSSDHSLLPDAWGDRPTVRE